MALSLQPTHLSLRVAMPVARLRRAAVKLGVLRGIQVNKQGEDLMFTVLLYGSDDFTVRGEYELLVSLFGLVRGAQGMASVIRRTYNGI